MNYVPVYDKDGNVVVVDAYDSLGRWLGSRMTLEGVKEEFQNFEETNDK